VLNIYNKNSKGFTHSNSRKSLGGFTIIEVLIVLAIAGLIMLIVFLAVPALQRNSRNTGRRSEGARIAVAVAELISTNGRNPNYTYDAVSIYKNAGGPFNYLGILTPNVISTCVANSMKDHPGNIAICSQATVTLNIPDADTVLIAATSTCGSSPNIIKPATWTQAAVFYTIETTDGYNVVCISV